MHITDIKIEQLNESDELIGIMAVTVQNTIRATQMNCDVSFGAHAAEGNLILRMGCVIVEITWIGGKANQKEIK